MRKLSEVFDGSIFLVQESLDRVADALEESWRSYGVKRRSCEGLQAMLDYFLPLEGGVRFVVAAMPGGEWSTVVENGWEAASDRHEVSLSLELGCRTITGVWAPDTAMLRVHDKGEKRRVIHCFYDSDRWEFYLAGEPFEFEEVSSYRKRRKKDRFTPPMLWRYLRELTGLQIPPDWPSVFRGRNECVERSLESLAVVPKRVEVEVDWEVGE